MKIVFRYQRKQRRKCTGEKKIRGNYRFARKICSMSISLPTTVWRTRNWASQGLKAENATALRKGLTAATSYAVAEDTTPMWSGTWRGVSVSLSGAATSAAEDAKA